MWFLKNSFPTQWGFPCEFCHIFWGNRSSLWEIHWWHRLWDDSVTLPSGIPGKWIFPLCQFYVLIWLVPQTFQTHCFPPLVGPLWNFPTFLSRNFKLVTLLRFDFWDFIYTILNSTKRNFHRGSPESDGKQKPTNPGTSMTKLIKVCLKCRLQAETWNSLWNLDFQICAIYPHPLWFLQSFSLSSWKTTLESIHFIRNGDVNFITFPGRIVSAMNSSPFSLLSILWNTLDYLLFVSSPLTHSWKGKKCHVGLS